MSAPHPWSAIAVAAEIEPGSATGIILDGHEYVLWRDTSGRAHAWEDRCPHRGMRLSIGFVRGARLACIYHGWQFDSAGRCQAIPAHPDRMVPERISVPSFPLIEAAGLLWLAPAPAAPLTIATQPVTPLRSLYLECPLHTALAALRATALPGFAGQAGPTQLHALPDAPAWLLDNGADRLLIAGQRIDANHAALHIVIAGPPARYAGAGQVHFARWAEAFRTAAEAAQPEAAA